MKATVDLNQSGVPLQLDFVATANTHYVQNPTSQKWQSVPADLESTGQDQPDFGRYRDPGVSKMPSTLPPNRWGSVLAEGVYRCGGRSQHRGLRKCEQRLGLPAVDRDGGSRVRHIQTVGAAETGEDPRLLRTIELSQFGDPVVIEVPQ